MWCLPQWEGQVRDIVDSRSCDGDVSGMHRIAPLMILALALATPQALAQNEPFRVYNRAAVPATGLHVARAGQPWGANLLRSPLAPNTFFSLRPGEGAGCRFDVRLVLQDQAEIVTRDADICAQRNIEMSGGPAAPPRGGMPRVIEGAPR